MTRILPLFALILVGCPKTATVPAPGAPTVEVASPPPVEEVVVDLPEAQSPREGLESALSTCKADAECFESIQLSDELLTSCPWYEAVGCSVAVAAAVAACVVTEGEACMEALELVAKTGCCDCLPSGTVRDMCKAI